MQLPTIPKETAFALKALAAGTANEGQQKAALAFILFTACDIRSPSYTQSDAYHTAFNEGRRYAGLIIAGAVEAKPAEPIRGKRGKPE